MCVGIEHLPTFECQQLHDDWRRVPTKPKGGVVVVVHHGMMMMGKLHIWSDSLINFVLVPHLVIVCTGKKKKKRLLLLRQKKSQVFSINFFTVKIVRIDWVLAPFHAGNKTETPGKKIN